MTKQPPKPAPFSTKAFLEFCRSKPVGETYNAVDPSRCALGQFGFREIGGECSAEHYGVPAAVFDAAISDPPLFSALASRLAKLEAE